jgi:7-carboxy-7-deazaguanine synthase
MLRVNEIFTSIQGESTHAGRPCTFVRLTGCNLRCGYCDTAYAFHEGSEMEVAEVAERVREAGVPLVEITGGEPLLQEEVHELMRLLLDAGHEVLLETSGSLSTGGVDTRAGVILDVKTPGSGESEANLWENLERLGPGDEVKFVITGRADYEWAREMVRERGLAARAPVHFSPAWGAVDPCDLAGWIVGDRLPVRLQLQLHKVIWPGETRGV